MSERTILLVEDNTDYQELMQLAFARSNIDHELVIMPNGVEALNYLMGREAWRDRDLSNMPKLVLLELNSAIIDGLEVLRRIRADSRTRFIPVAIVSTSTEPQDLIDSYRAGCNSYIRKPVDFAQLQIFIRELTLYWLTINEMPPVSGA